MTRSYRAFSLPSSVEDPGAQLQQRPPFRQLVEVCADLLELVAGDIRLPLDQAVLNPSSAHHGDQKDPLHPRAHEAYGA